ncbi:histone deacetylase complex subunit SAP130 isoform X3 [Adelges cooleyi]|uniref:histone deacetylase complex subunit SAP130 isoform X3 n=1 Tax=Adelges cooleyi TaxID=133065 RepID=UPI00217FD598|nr:histone deacetylase complex subunit SAP130 isoform X3 [Adelges cooleyi]
MSDFAERVKDNRNTAVLKHPYTGVGAKKLLPDASKHTTKDPPSKGFRRCNSPSRVFAAVAAAAAEAVQLCNAPSSNSKSSNVPKLALRDRISDEVSIYPVLLQQNKSLSASQSHRKGENLMKTIGLVPARSPMAAQSHSRIIASNSQRTIMESQSTPPPLILSSAPHVIHTTTEIISSKVAPVYPVAPHLSVINKTSSAPGCSDDSNVTVTSGNQHLFKPIISPRPSILRKRDADGVLKAQKNLIPILTKTDNEECQIAEEALPSRNGYGETTICQLPSPCVEVPILVPQVTEAVLPQIATLQRVHSHMMIDISPRKKPRKQLLPVNQDSPFKIVSDDMEYVVDKTAANKLEKIEEYTEEDLPNDDCADGDAEDELEDELDDMDVDDDCPADDDYDEDEEDYGNDFGDADSFPGFDFSKAEKSYFEDGKISTDLSDASSNCNPMNKRPTLLGRIKNTWRGQSQHFQKHSDFKVKENKKQLAEMQQAKKWQPESRSGWKVQRVLKQFEELIAAEDGSIEYLTGFLQLIERHYSDQDYIIELIKDNIQRCKVTKDQLEEITRQLSKIFEHKPAIDDIAEKYGPKDLKKKCVKIFIRT